MVRSMRTCATLLVAMTVLLPTNGHSELPPAEPRFGIDCLVYVDRTIQTNPATHIVFDIVLAPFEEIVIALAPGYGPIAIANVPQD